MPVELFKKICNDHSHDRIKLCGEHGDPIMHPELDAIFDSVEKKGIIEVHTNGGMRDPEWFKHVTEKYKVEFHFGIDTFRGKEDLYRINVNTDLAFDNMIASLSTGLPTYWEYTMFSYNEKYISDVLDFMIEYPNLYLNLRKNAHFTEDISYDNIWDLIQEKFQNNSMYWNRFIKTFPINVDTSGKKLK